MRTETSSPRPALLPFLVILLAGFLVEYPALNGDWLWDDALYLTANPLLRESGRLWKAWFVPGSFLEYYPLEQTVQWAQWKLWGNATFGYHLTNLVLHLLNALLVWRLLAKFGLRWAWLGGLIFAVHPMNVESVAYISELKNTLSLPFFLLALCAFIDFEETRHRRDYLLTLACFLLAMLAKITMLTFPFVMLLYAWWKRDRLDGKDFLHAAPFLLISIILGATTVWAGQHFEQLYPSHPAAWPMGGFFARLLLSGKVLASYFAHFLWPLHPLPIYPRWNPERLTPADGLPWLLGLGLFGLLWLRRKSWGRPTLLGLGFFVLTLLPFSGLVVISYMNYTWVMDHFLYLPMIGLIGLVVALLEQIRARLSPRLRPLFIAAMTVVMLFLTIRAQDYAAVWTDPNSLWTYTVARNPEAWLAHYNLGNDFRLHGQFDAAIQQYRETIALAPNYDWAHNNLGLALGHFPDRLPEAISEYRIALALRPDSAEAHNNLANTLLQLPGNESEALAEYQAALRAKPSFIEARYNLALLLAKTGRIAQARAELEEILRQDPDFSPAQTLLENLATAPVSP